ncbi:hypothetical protein CYQ88_11150 [Hydrogenovibrio sp. SC-1]|uniref:hypothetical protein n=1 Tax=Hydrogenovibrio sp. SC-1 TaxID=2065820 RepID=UPI000C7A26E0|nr:hypothetical protein [Hydrogenovibrio sp. SC-1]PLA73441.1 hypothetical protein CYQ88_11150 [Hydrogenovibrio sp. SC-1]
MNLLRVLAAWQTADFTSVLNTELQRLDKSNLPLQQGLTVSNRVADTNISFMLLNVKETEQALLLTVMVFYDGLEAGDCCADDPTPVCEQPEQCTVKLTIHKPNGEAEISLLPEDE